MKYIVYKDTREQAGWEFEEGTNCGGMEVVTLSTGDYTVKGLEHLLAIERKGSVAEFARNIVDKRFEKELVRLQKYYYPFIILEFELDDIMRFPEGSGIPRIKWPHLKISPWFILKRLVEFQVKYKAKILFAGKHGKSLAASIFKRVVEDVEAANPTF
jgi:ERCC4-type nuclease